DEDNCMVDIAKFFLSFTQSESCGKCPPCRIGTYQMLQILEKITSGNGEEGDIEKLKRLGESVAAGSLCGLGQSAPNPVLTTIRYFRDEYEEHIKDKYCRAKVCSGMGIFEINQEECIECGLCKQACAFSAVIETKNKYFIARDYCTGCKACYHACPVDAVKLLSPRHIRLEEEFKIPLESIDIIERRCKMTLKNIIESKSLMIVTITKDQTISDAVKIMGERNVSGVFVVDENNKLVGIFTERDIVRCVVNGISLENEVIENIMRTDITTFDPSMEISSAIAVASKKKIRHLPVVEEDKIVGMITFRDLVSYLLPEICYMAKEIY
ncbi:MAG: NADH-ubiquinone oxidoreductase-F iron-sulfur binding region domain-containing protein, partial [Thermodesulfovibrionales bacterium]